MAAHPVHGSPPHPHPPCAGSHPIPPHPPPPPPPAHPSCPPRRRCPACPPSPRPSGPPRRRRGPPGGWGWVGGGGGGGGVRWGCRGGELSLGWGSVARVGRAHQRTGYKRCMRGAAQRRCPAMHGAPPRAQRQPCSCGPTHLCSCAPRGPRLTTYSCVPATADSRLCAAILTPMAARSSLWCTYCPLTRISCSAGVGRGAQDAN